MIRAEEACPSSAMEEDEMKNEVANREMNKKDGSPGKKSKEENKEGKGAGSKSESEVNSDDNDNDRDDNASQEDDSMNSDDESDESKDANDVGSSEGRGLSEYELMRLERIKRNKQYLAQLGLDGKNGGGVLGENMKRSRKKSRTKSVADSKPKGQLRPTRKSGRQRPSIDYTLPSLAAPLTASGKKEKSSKKSDKSPKTPVSAKPKRGKAQRQPLFIYQECCRVKAQNRNAMKEAKRNLRAAERELRYFTQKAETFKKKRQQEMEIERFKLELERERQVLGGVTCKELLEDIDKRLQEIILTASAYDRRFQEEAHRQLYESQRLEAENKMMMIDALERFPESMKNAYELLDSALMERVPRGTPQTALSKRKLGRPKEAKTVNKTNGQAESVESQLNARPDVAKNEVSRQKGAAACRSDSLRPNDQQLTWTGARTEVKATTRIKENVTLLEGSQKDAPPIAVGGRKLGHPFKVDIYGTQFSDQTKTAESQHNGQPELAYTDGCHQKAASTWQTDILCSNSQPFRTERTDIKTPTGISENEALLQRVPKESPPTAVGERKLGRPFEVDSNTDQGKTLDSQINSQSEPAYTDSFRQKVASSCQTGVLRSNAQPLRTGRTDIEPPTGINESEALLEQIKETPPTAVGGRKRGRPKVGKTVKISNDQTEQTQRQPNSRPELANGGSGQVVTPTIQSGILTSNHQPLAWPWTKAAIKTPIGMPTNGMPLEQGFKGTPSTGSGKRKPGRPKGSKNSSKSNSKVDPPHNQLDSQSASVTCDASWLDSTSARQSDILSSSTVTGTGCRIETQIEENVNETCILNTAAEEKVHGINTGRTNNHTNKLEITPQNVGGWVSQKFAKEISRAWLERESPLSHFDLRKYIPQIGDTVLYYPSGHRAFLGEHADILGNKFKIANRTPLWERAKKEQTKLGNKETSQGQPLPFLQNLRWWSDKWLSEFESGFEKYPLVCRVEHTQAEFPPDPYAEKQIGTSKNARADCVRSNKRMRLAVTLQPLTPLLPPVWNDSGPYDTFPLQLPPKFVVVTFPSPFANPFMIPFSWGYTTAHSLEIEDKVDVIGSDEGQKGVIREFSSLGSKFGSFRLDDKAEFASFMLAQFKSDYDSMQVSLEKALADSQKKRKNLGPVPLPDAVVVVECISHVLAGKVSPKPLTKMRSGGVNLMDFIRCTVPLWGNVVMIQNSQDHKVDTFSAWELRPRSSRYKAQHGALSSFLTFVQEGHAVPCRLDEALRMKIESTVEDFIKDDPDSTFFRYPVTENDAPGYSCAVPISMSFERILHRIKCPKSSREGSKRCYYTSVDSIIADFNCIVNNCILYNNPESDIVIAAVRVISALKRRVSKVSSAYMHECKKKLKDEEEKRRFVMLQCAPSLMFYYSSNDVKTGKHIHPSLSDTTSVPFKEPLYSDWIQRACPDETWKQSTENTSAILQEDEKINFETLDWMPQVGDNILYSRSLHADFVRGHYPSLHTNQCVLPRFRCNSQEINDDNDYLSRVLQAGWIIGYIVRVRASFPRPLEKEEGKNTFHKNSPLLALDLRFDGGWFGNDIHEVYWRPCIFPSANLSVTEEASIINSSSSQSDGGHCCASCGIPCKRSFLVPAWTPLDDDDEIFKPSNGISAEIASPIGVSATDTDILSKCFNFLKWRCLNGISPDFIDQSFQQVKAGYVPPADRIGAESLPTFEAIFKTVSERAVVSTTRKQNEGPAANGTERVIPLLSEMHFLPPWMFQSGALEKDDRGTEVPFHVTISPWPMLCLELILLRINKGYYRQKAAIQGDVIEAYVSSVLLCLLSELSLCKTEEFSARKIAKHLCMIKRPENCNSVKDIINISYPMEISQGSDNVKRKAKNNNIMTATEVSLFKRIHQVRLLYATCLVCISDTMYVERLFGLREISPLFNSLPPNHEVEVAARQKIAHLLAAIGRDKCSNRIFSRSNYPPVVRIKVLYNGEIVVGEPPEDKGRDYVDETLKSPQVEIHDFIAIKKRDYSDNDALVRFFHGAVGRMNVCARCKVFRQSLYHCRVTRAHSNVDFDWIDFFKGVGGVDGLLKPLLPHANDKTTAPLNNKPPNTSSPAMNGECEKTVKLAGPRNAESAQTTNTTSALTPPKEDYADETSTKIQTIAPEEPQQQHHSLHIADEACTVVPTPKVSNGDGGGDVAHHQDEKAATREESDVNFKPNQDPLELFRKAQNALNLAREIAAKATVLAMSPPRLSQEFMATYFPVDPSDGHYTYCLICGLSGNVMCCDGCANVAHAECVFLPNIPEDDWFCDFCVSAGKNGRLEPGTKKVVGKSSQSGDTNVSTETGLQPTSIESSLGETQPATESNSAPKQGKGYVKIFEETAIESALKTEEASKGSVGGTIESVSTEKQICNEKTDFTAVSKEKETSGAILLGTKGLNADGDSKGGRYAIYRMGNDDKSISRCEEERVEAAPVDESAVIQKKLESLSALLDELYFFRNGHLRKKGTGGDTNEDGAKEDGSNGDGANEDGVNEDSANEGSANEDSANEDGADGDEMADSNSRNANEVASGKLKQLETSNHILEKTNDCTHDITCDPKIENTPEPDTDAEENVFKIRIGTRIRKSFGYLGDFDGKVVGMPSAHKPYYGIQYDDGDYEELSESEVGRLVVYEDAGNFSSKKATACTDMGVKKRKSPSTSDLTPIRPRGRPRKKQRYTN